MENENLKPVQTIPPFTKMIMTIGALPTSFYSSMSYYESMVWLYEYLKNTVIPTVNNNGEAVIELQEKFTLLKTWIDEYFDNLDVQEEIDKKLDEMAEDGSLTNLIKAYVDPIYEAYETEINGEISDYKTLINGEMSSFKNTVNNSIATINTKVDNATSGSPLVATSTDDMTETNRVYVNTSDGKWYYYDGDSWEIGGTYQSSGINNKSINGDKTTFLDGYNKILLDDTSGSEIGIDYSISNGIITVDGTATSTSYIGFNIPSLTLTGIYVYSCSQVATTGVEFAIHRTVGGWLSYPLDRIQGLYEDGSHTYDKVGIRFENGTEVNNLVIKPMLVEESIYDTLDTFYSYNDALTNSGKIKDIGKIIKESNTTFLQQSENLVDPRKLLDGYIQSNTNGRVVLTSSDEYKSIVLYNNSSVQKTYTVYPRYRMYGYYKQPGGYTHDNTAVSQPTLITIPAYGRFNVTFYAEDLPNVMVKESESVVNTFTPFNYHIDYLDVNNEITSTNVLANKKYCALGDSFTHGDFSHSPTTDYYITEGKFAGQYKVYPYIIGNRNNMNISNLSVNGMTLASRDGSTNSMIQSEVYKTIPEDADYITIKIGINDNNQSLPIGTIDSEDTSTFYGAYNEVMSYIIEHYPNAKIGLIATNGASVDQVNATINIGSKYGIPVLNESTDPNVPLLIRTNRTDVPSSIKNIRNNNWFVKPSGENQNWHPNAKCHEYESTIIENFLRSL